MWSLDSIVYWEELCIDKKNLTGGGVICGGGVIVE